jgi:hypothetical protein
MKSRLFILTLCVGLTGCFATAPAAKQQAKLTLSMLSELDEASQTFAEEHARSTTYLNRASAEQRAGLLAAKQVFAREQAAATAIADEKAEAVQKRLAPLVTTLEQNNAGRKTMEDLEKETRELIAPLPNLSQNLTSTKKTVATLLEGVSAETRLKELQAYYDIARKSVKDAKEKLKESESTTPGTSSASAAP